jgi:hypothetical protein
MKRKGNLKARLAVLLLAGALAPLAPITAPARADVLVTKDGGKVETKGAWTVKGKLVVFQTADGKLSSLRLADVDLDASRKATEQAAQPKPEGDSAQPAKAAAKAAPKKASVLHLTDKDVRHPEDEAAAGGSGDGKAAAVTSGPGVVVADWQQVRDDKDGHVVIKGTVQNASPNTAADVKLAIVIYDENGTQIATSQAALTANALPPGQKGMFKADFPGFYSFATLKFNLDSRSLTTRQPGDTPPPPPPPGG